MQENLIYLQGHFNYECASTSLSSLSTLFLLIWVGKSVDGVNDVWETVPPFSTPMGWNMKTTATWNGTEMASSRDVIRYLAHVTSPFFVSFRLNARSLFRTRSPVFALYSPRSTLIWCDYSKQKLFSSTVEAFLSSAHGMTAIWKDILMVFAVLWFFMLRKTFMHERKSPFFVPTQNSSRSNFCNVCFWSRSKQQAAVVKSEIKNSLNAGSHIMSLPCTEEKKESSA